MEETNGIIALWNLLPVWLQIALGAIGAFAAAAAGTPNKSPNPIVDFILKAINLFGANFGKASNKDE